MTHDRTERLSHGASRGVLRRAGGCVIPVGSTMESWKARRHGPRWLKPAVVRTEFRIKGMKCQLFFESRLGIFLTESFHNEECNRRPNPGAFEGRALLRGIEEFDSRV